MIQIHLTTLGKLKETYWREAEAEYLKRLKPYAKITIHELKEESFSEKDNPEIIKRKEAEKITNILDKIKDAFVIVLDEHGQQLTSVQLAQSLNNETMKQCNNVAFVIGGPLGLDPGILKKSNHKISLSRFTFTHQMARVILVEQIYRAIMIINKRKYHH